MPQVVKVSDALYEKAKPLLGKDLSQPEVFDQLFAELPQSPLALKPECLFGYWRKVKDEFNRDCHPQIRNPDLRDPANKDILDYCKQCDMKQKALIRYKAAITKKPTPDYRASNPPRSSYSEDYIPKDDWGTSGRIPR